MTEFHFEYLRKRIAERQKKIDKVLKEIDTCVRRVRTLRAWQDRDGEKLKELKGAVSS